MPSHISHALLIEDALADQRWRSYTPGLGSFVGDDPRATAIAVLGAQGPDLFLHNHRRKPRGFRYGALLHRRGNAELIESLARNAAGSKENREPLIAYILGYISHVVLDRTAHPYINHFAGWRGVPDKHPDRPMMHAFLERCIDVLLLDDRRSQNVVSYDLYGRLPAPGADLLALRRAIVRALRAALRSAGDDDQIERRISNALADAYGFYRYTNAPDDPYFREGRRRERHGIVNRRWLSLVHPPRHLVDVDVLNEKHAQWCHPCDEARVSDSGFLDLYELALSETVEIGVVLLEAIAEPSDARFSRLRIAVGPNNLNDGITGDPPCRRVYCNPLPLIALYNRIKTEYDS